MEIDSIRNKALRRFFEEGVSKGLPEPVRIGRMLAFIVATQRFEEFNIPPNYGFHPLTGDRKGHFAMTVTRNWRMTFIRLDENTVGELDLEDYH